MNMYSAGLDIAGMFLFILSAPLYIGWIKMLKSWMQGRRSASIFQPYRDIRKLFAKDVFISENASWIFRVTPYIVFSTMVLSCAIVPLLTSNRILAPTADVIVLIGLFSIARFFTALAGMDIGTSFGGMGSSREMMISSLAEPAMLITIFTISLANKSTSLSSIVAVTVAHNTSLHPSFLFAFIAFILITLAENGRVPVDNPSTHLELTMIHEAMILEYSGRHLALLEWGSMIKLFLFTAIGIAAFAPWGISITGALSTLPLAIIAVIIKFMITGFLIVLIETSLAKMRIFRVPEFLGSAFLLATLGMLSFFILD
jgi:formate hydrogenlyase subunit 4